MKKTEEKIIKFIQEHKLIQNGDKILIALSGGPDSVFLFHFLLKYKKKYRVEIGAMHLNHMIRGKEADADEQFCRNLCLKFGIKFYCVKRNVLSFAKKNKISTEEGARKIRYEELEKIQQEYGYDKIASGHTSSDNTETVLLNLIKGAGIKGLSGIPISRGKIIRPILSIGKEEILDYLHTKKISYRVDQTNFLNSYERNFIRNEIIPLIKRELNPKVDQTLLKSSLVLKGQASVLQSVVRLLSEFIISKKNEKLELNIALLNRVEKSIWSDLVKFSVDDYFQVQSSFNDCRKIVELISKQAGKGINISNNLHALRERSGIVIYKAVTENKIDPIEFGVGETIKFNAKKLKIRLVDKSSVRYSANKNVEYISGDRVKHKFILRTWKPGDKFYPLGLKGSKNVSDFLNDKKVEVSEKNNQTVLINNKKIVWVVGHGIDNRFKVTEKSRKVLELCLE